MNCDLNQNTSYTTKKEYRFHAGTAKEERILGLCFPFVFMGILLICILLLELFFPLQHFTKLLNQYYFIEVVIILVGLLPSVVILKSIKKRLGHEFRVVIEKQSMGIEIDGAKQMIGDIAAIHIKQNNQCIRIALHAKNKTIYMIGRSNQNPSGFCTENDLKNMRNLAEQLDVLSNQTWHNLYDERN